MSGSAQPSRACAAPFVDGLSRRPEATQGSTRRQVVRSRRGGGVAPRRGAERLGAPERVAKTSAYSKTAASDDAALDEVYMSCCSRIVPRRNSVTKTTYVFSRSYHPPPRWQSTRDHLSRARWHSNARSRRITGVKTKRFNMSGGPYGGKSSLATVRVHRLARAPPRTGKYLDIATDRSVPRSLASSVHARRCGRGRTRLRGGDGHLHRPGTSRARLSSPRRRNLSIVTFAARGPPDDRCEGPSDDSRVSPSVLSSRKVPRTDGRTSR